MTVPPVFWVIVGVAAFGAYIVGHRRAVSSTQVATESQEASVPLQPYVQPQPPPANSYLAYGQVPFGTDASSNTIGGQVVYTSPVGAFVG